MIFISFKFKSGKNEEKRIEKIRKYADNVSIGYRNIAVNTAGKMMQNKQKSMQF